MRRGTERDLWRWKRPALDLCKYGSDKTMNLSNNPGFLLEIREPKLGQLN